MFVPYNDQRNRAAAVDVDFKSRVTRRSGSRNGYLLFVVGRSLAIVRHCCIAASTSLGAIAAS